jgi:fluoride exporter
MINVFLIGIGGAFGSVARYLVSSWVQAMIRNTFFPLGTLTVNVVGCFVIGFLAQLAEARGFFTSEARAFVFIGILGGFTTFSTFGNETYNLAHNGELTSALANIGANVILGLLAVWAGHITASLIWG